MAADLDCFLQNHLSENGDELEVVKTLFPQAQNYTQVYADAGCVGRKSLLGHGILLSEAERKVILEKQATVVHCPTSNRFLSNHTLGLRNYLDEGLAVTLGTDVAGGTSLSLISEMKEACEAAKARREGAVSFSEVFYLATLGAARVLGIDQNVGSLEVGKDADFILVDDTLCHPHCDPEHPNALRGLNDPLEDRLSRMMYRAHPDMVKLTCVRGRQVYSNLD